MSYVQNTPEFDPIDMNSVTEQNVHIQSLPGNMIHMLGLSICSSRMQVFGCSIQRHDVADP
jgi:hypothetical protein